MPKNFITRKKLNSERRSCIKESLAARRILRILSLHCILILSLGTIVFGQNTQHTENKADQVLRGSGRVNPSSLGMEIDIPLGSYPGRGINIPVGLSYSSKLWRLEYLRSQPRSSDPSQCVSVNNPQYGENSASGWTTSMAMPYIEYTGEDNLFDDKGFPVSEIICPSGNGTLNHAYIKRLTVHLPSGETHELRANDTPVVYPSSQIPPFDWNTTFYAADGSNIKYVENAATGLYRLLMPDGSFYDFAPARASLNLATIRKANKFSDRNGNYTSYFEPNSTDSNGVTHPNGYWKDTLGRNIPIPLKPEAPEAPTVQNYQMPGMSGFYKLHWKKLKDTTAAESGLADFSQQLKSTSQLFPSDYYNLVVNSTVAFNPIVLTAVELPTGQFYRFKYDIYGEIEQVQYPTGGEELFTYAAVPPLGDIGNSNLSSNVHWRINRGVNTRKVYETIGSGDYLPWTYTADRTNGYVVSIVAPDGTRTERFLYMGSFNCTSCSTVQGSWGYDNALTGMAYEERGYNSAGQIISRKLTHWTKTTFPALNNRTKDWHPRVTQEESIIYDETGNGLSTSVKYEYEGDLSLRETPVLTNKTTQYAFVAAPNGNSLPPHSPPDPNPSVPPVPVRITETTYLINDAINYPDQNVRNAYKNQNMVGLVTVSKVKNGAGTIVVAQSETKYDESSLYPLISVGTTTNWQDPNNIYRGNPTTSRIWDSTKGFETNPNAYIATHAQFDGYGNQRKIWDAKGSITETDYASPSGQDYKFAFPTKLTTSVPDPNPSANPDGLAHGSQTAFVSETTFDATTGLPLTTKDVNGQITTIQYDPVTLRVKKVIPPSGAGESETVYHDEPNNYWVKSRTQIDTNKWAESITYFDGLGRAYKSEQVHSQGNVFVEKEFDQDGRVKRVTNPFRANEAKQWTTNIYDEASRVKEVILPDGSNVKTDYGVSISGTVGVTKTITDQSGKKRRGISDALGRMIQVIEDPNGQNLTTDYVFDTLGNLRKTTQGDQNRYFSYDSLGRLLRAKQPEQKANTALALPVADAITQHNQWSVKYEYDDGGNITSTTDADNISVSATYDKFNRLIFRNYSDATPDVYFFYDGTGLGSIPAYSKGKTTKAASSVSETRYTSFDNLGRLLTSEQRTPFGTETAEQATPRAFIYKYNLSGALVEETYPSGRVVQNSFNQDGELLQVQSKKASTGFWAYAKGFGYNSSGAVTKMRLGNGHWETYAYNNRGQITQIGLGTTDAQTDLLKLEYSYNTPNAADNNGNMKSQTMTVPSVGGSAGFVAVQNYSYDSLNRLEAAQETISGAQTWKQTFLYDRYGNRRFDAAGNNTTTLGNCPQIECNPTIDTATNQFAEGQGYLYDKDGNVTRDASGKQFFYDAENHQKEVKDQYGNTIGQYLYDGEGKRVKKISLQEVTVFVYNANSQLAAEYSTQTVSQPQVSYLTADHLSSPRVITDAEGKVKSRKDYTAFGETTQTAQRTANLGYEPPNVRQGYTGYEKDVESGLEFAQARYYNATHGRFTSVDPLTASVATKNPQTFNRYSYVLNSPYKYTDPLGLIPEPKGVPILDGGRCAKRDGKCIPGPLVDLPGVDLLGLDGKNNEIGATLLVPKALIDQLDMYSKVLYDKSQSVGEVKGSTYNELDSMKSNMNQLSNMNYGDRLIKPTENSDGLIIVAEEVEATEGNDVNAGISVAVQGGGTLTSSATVKYSPGKAVSAYNEKRKELNKLYGTLRKAFIRAWAGVEVPNKSPIVYKSAILTEDFLGQLFDQRAGIGFNMGITDGFLRTRRLTISAGIGATIP
jgi:RHS repeat-associated protein